MLIISLPKGIKLLNTLTLNQIMFRIGYPYLYRHKGSCDHIFIIEDIRVMSSLDSKNTASYPRVIYQSKTKRQLCSICKSKFSMCISKLGSKYLYLCTECANIGLNGQNDELIPYIHD